MISYGKANASWNDVKFSTMIEDALRMARKHRQPYAVGHDENGIAVVSVSINDYPFIFACVATAWNDKAFQEGRIELVDNVAYRNYSVEEMVPRVRGVLTRGVVEYGSLRFLSEGIIQTGEAVSCAHRLVKLYGYPFIVGLTDKGVTVAPLSEQDRFLDVASCIVTENEVWSMSDKLPVGGGYWVNRDTPLTADAPAKCSIKIRNPAEHIYCSILESKGMRHGKA